MLLNSRAVAIVFGVTIAGITTAFLGLLPEITGTALVVAFALSFSSSYILLRILAEFLFFREINNIYDALNGIEKNDITFLTNRSSSFLNPLRKVKNEINDYARIKQREIDDLKRMETFRREFIADVSHELKTPIFSAQGFVHTLLDGAVEDKKVRGKFLKKAAKSLDGLDLLVQDLLTISQMEIGQIKMHYENFDLVDLCKEVIEQLDGKAEKKEITIEQSFEKAEIYVNADFQRIYQVMINLVNNAIKYNRKDGKVNIHIATLEAEEKVEIKVSDSGRGIPEEDIGRIFERFYRVEKSRSKDRGGTGLGLSIVKHIMDGHHSRVEVVSEVDKGSTFTLWLKLGSPTQKISWEDDDEYDKDT